MTERPYLVEDTAITPDVTGCGVFTIVESLRGRPLDGNLPSVGHVEVFLLEVSRKSKVCNLKSTEYNVMIFRNNNHDSSDTKSAVVH